MTQFVRNPTRYCNSGRGNILDIVLCDDQLFVDVLKHHPALGTSDHSMVEFILFFPEVESNSGSADSTPEQITVPAYDWSEGNYDAINNAINEVDWHQLFGFNFDSDALWSSFKTIIWPIIDMFIPKKQVHHLTKYKTRMYPKFIRRLLARKLAIWRILKHNFSHATRDKYNQLAKECSDAILAFDIERENKMLKSNNLGKFYKFVNHKLSSRSGIAPLKNVHGTIIINDDEKANLLNTYFHSVFTVDNGILPNFPTRFITPPSPELSSTISDVRISPNIVKCILGKLKTNSAAGPDRLPPILLNRTASSISFPLSILFRSIVDLHELPLEWKTSIVTPISLSSLLR